MSLLAKCLLSLTITITCFFHEGQAIKCHSNYNDSLKRTSHEVLDCVHAKQCYVFTKCAERRNEWYSCLTQHRVMSTLYHLVGTGRGFCEELKEAYHCEECRICDTDLCNQPAPVQLDSEERQVAAAILAIVDGSWTARPSTAAEAANTTTASSSTSTSSN